MMANDELRIRYVIDDSSARATNARSVKDLARVEAAALKAATALEQAHARVTSAAASGIAAQVSGHERITAAALNGASRRVQVAKEEAAKIDVGLHKLQVSGIKFQEQLTASTT